MYAIASLFNNNNNHNNNYNKNYFNKRNKEN